MNTQQRSVRVDAETWALALARAQREHRKLSDVIRVALRAYAADTYDGIEPPRSKP